MKSKRIALVMVCLFFILTACKESADPAEVATAFVDSTIYYKDSEAAEKYFYQLKGTKSKDLAEDFKKIFELTDDQAKELVAIYSEKLDKETSFSAQVVDEKKTDKVVEITVIGLDQSGFDKDLDKQTDAALVNYLQKKGHSSIKKIEDIDKIAEEDELKKIADTFDKMTDDDYAAIQYEALKQAFQSLKAEKKSNRKVQMKIKRDEKEKNYWQVVDEEETFNALLDAFQG